MLDHPICGARGEVVLAAPESGMNVIAWLPEQTDDAAVQAAAARQDIQLYALSGYAARRPARPGLILGFAAILPHELKPKLWQLREIIRR